MPERRLPPHPSQIIDRSKPISFEYEGRRISGYEGDTVASALYASGVDIFGRSFKYHRPRGLLCVSGRCPNCMMNVDGTPNVRACACAAADAETVKGQNAWPSVEKDALSVLQRFDRLMPVGFYYKTLVQPKLAWHLAEPVIRRVAGLGTVDPSLVPETEYEHVNAYTDVAVVGGGPAGMSAALAAAEAGARVTLIDEAEDLGGHLRYETLPHTVPNALMRFGEGAGDGDDFAALGYQMAKYLAGQVEMSGRIRVYSGASAMALYQDNMITVHQGKQIIKLRANQVVIATGAQESPPVFPNNDLPGIMLSSGALRLVNLYGVSPGNQGVIFTNCDDGLRAAAQLLNAGVRAQIVVDSRMRHNCPFAEDFRERNVTLLQGWKVVNAEGVKKLRSVLLESTREGAQRRVNCDFPVPGTQSRAGNRAALPSRRQAHT